MTDRTSCVKSQVAAHRPPVVSRQVHPKSSCHVLIVSTHRSFIFTARDKVGNKVYKKRKRITMAMFLSRNEMKLALVESSDKLYDVGNSLYLVHGVVFLAHFGYNRFFSRKRNGMAIVLSGCAPALVSMVMVQLSLFTHALVLSTIATVLDKNE